MSSQSRHPLRLFAALLFSTAAFAQGQPAGDAERCANITNNPDLAIQHCTKAIESGKFTGDSLAQLHYNRGIEWAAKSVYDRAIADYDVSLKLNPRNFDALYNRGNAWGSKGDHDRAIADYDAAIGLNPKDAAAHNGRAFELTAKGDYASALAAYDTALRLQPKSSSALLARGRVLFYSGDYLRATSDLEQSLKLDYNDYTAMWLYLARKRAGTANAEELLDSETRLSRSGAWPAVIIVLYLGRTDPDSVFASSMDHDARRQRDQRCEANFYVAHWHLIRGNSERALPLLKEARNDCPREFLEYEGATAELRRLAK